MMVFAASDYLKHSTARLHGCPASTSLLMFSNVVQCIFWGHPGERFTISLSDKSNISQGIPRYSQYEPSPYHKPASCRSEKRGFNVLYDYFHPNICFLPLATFLFVPYQRIKREAEKVTPNGKLFVFWQERSELVTSLELWMAFGVWGLVSSHGFGHRTPTTTRPILWWRDDCVIRILVGRASFLYEFADVKHDFFEKQRPHLPNGPSFNIIT
jgi:hypothetical protein